MPLHPIRSFPRIIRRGAREYALRYPSRSGDLHDFGETFGEFLRLWEPTAHLVYLHDVAKLEWAMHLPSGGGTSNHPSSTSTSPQRSASSAACVRSARPSLLSTALTWFRTVPSATCR